MIHGGGGASESLSQPQLHIAYLLDSLVSGGAQRQAVELACWLKRNHLAAVSFLVYSDLDFFGVRLARLGIPVLRLPRGHRFDLSVVWRLRRALLDVSPDVVHAFLPPSVLYGFLATRLMGKERPVFVAAERSALRTANSRGLWLERLVYPRSDAVTVNSEAVAVEMARRICVREDRIRYIPNGIDLDEWDSAASRKSPISFDRDVFHVGVVGGLREEKNHVVLVEALGKLSVAEREGLIVWFIGGRTGAAGVAERIVEAVRHHRLESLVRFEAPTLDIASVMARLSCVILPSAFEGFPNVLLEAMASRLPTIATRVGDVPRLLQEGETGWIVDPGDAEALLCALRRVRACSSAARQRMGDRARSKVEGGYRMVAIARRYLALYQELAGDRRPMDSIGQAAAPGGP